MDIVRHRPRRTILSLWLALALIPPTTAAAQVTCRERADRPALSIGVAATASDLDVAAPLDDPSPFVSTHVGSGPGASINGSAPLFGSWSVRASSGGARLGAERITLSRGVNYEEISRRSDGTAHVRHLQLGLVNAIGDGRRLCGYAGLAAGVLRMTYKGVTTRPISVSGLLGFEMPLGAASTNALAIEFQLDVANNAGSHAPFRDYTVSMLGATLAFRHRF